MWSLRHIVPRALTAASLTRCERAADVTVGVFPQEKLTDISTILSQRSCKL